MNAWLAEVLTQLATSPHWQGLVAALATFVLEDPTTIGCGLLVAERKMAFLTALVGVSAGIAVGDAGLYGLGRAVGPQVAGWRLVPPHRLERAGRWFGRNLVLAVILSRFVPGMRLPTYVGAGVLKAPFARFVVIAVGASLVWTFLLLRLTTIIGAVVLPLLGRFRWPVAIAAVALLVLLQRRTVRTLHGPGGDDGRRVLSPFELWPSWLFYTPVVLYYAFLALRNRGIMLPTAANPSIYSGGFIGESNATILDLVPPETKPWVARYTVFERTADRLDDLVARARRAMEEAGLAYPLVAKPDVGQRGHGVRPVRSDAELRHYLLHFPPGERILLQELAGGGDAPAELGAGRPPWLAAVREAGVMYWRMPGAERGELSSLTLKLLPALIGDGRRTVGELIDADPRARHLRQVYARHLRGPLDRVLAAGERLPLVFAGNHCQGAIFKDGRPLVTPALMERIEAIARSIPGFYFGRFDVRFADPEAFLRGEGFKIIEINGAGAEATHIWDASTRLVDAYATLFAQFRMLFAIGAANRRRGHRPFGVVRLLRDSLTYRRLARSYPATR